MGLKRFLLIFSDRIFDSSVDRTNPNFAAARDGPNMLRSPARQSVRLLHTGAIDGAKMLCNPENVRGGMPRASRGSKCHLEPELNLSRRCHGLEDASCVRSWNGVSARITAEENLITISTTGPNGSSVYRHVEIGVIEEVEEVSAKLQADPLLETHLF